jgi:hypothetical protein
MFHQGYHEGKVVGPLHNVRDKNKESVNVVTPIGSIFGNLALQIKQGAYSLHSNIP